MEKDRPFPAPPAHSRLRGKVNCLAVDHCLPVRLIRRFGNPHHPINLGSTCRRCHGLKKSVEDRLFEGDFLGFILGLKGLGWDLSKVKAAFDFYGLQWPEGVTCES